jgi:hypothetical protein
MSKKKYDRWAVTAAMKCGMKAPTGNTALTKHTPVDLPSKTLDAVSLLVHAPEVVSPYRTNARDQVRKSENEDHV